MLKTTIFCLLLLANSLAQEQLTSQVLESSEEMITEENLSTIAEAEDSVTNNESEEEYTPDADGEQNDDYGDQREYPSEDEEEDVAQHYVIQKPRAIVMRCSRRFTPGSCGEPVTSVWTYVFDEQNCTERLGCLLSTRENRFRSFNRCYRLCMQLSKVFSRVLDMQKDHKFLNKRVFGINLRRSERLRWDQNKETSNLPPLSDSESENEGRPVAREYYDYIERRKPMAYDDYNFVNGADEFLVAPDLDEFGVNSNALEDFERNFDF